MPKRRIIEEEITHISLVGKGANNKNFFLFKSKSNNADGKYSFVKESSFIHKNDLNWKVAYCVVSEPDVEDLQEDIQDAKSISKSCHNALKNGIIIDTNHNFKKEFGCEIVENAIALIDMEIGNNIIKKGSWYIAVEVNKKMHDKIENNEITGISRAGLAIIEVLSKATKIVESNNNKSNPQSTNLIIKAAKVLIGKNKENRIEITRELLKDFATEISNKFNNDIYIPLDALWYSIMETYWNAETIDEIKDGIKLNCEQFLEHINTMTFEVKSVNKNKGNQMTREETLALIKEVNEKDTKVSIAKTQVVELEELRKGNIDLTKQVNDINKQLKTKDELILTLKAEIAEYEEIGKQILFSKGITEPNPKEKELSKSAKVGKAIFGGGK